jgi:hypothetical protein
MADLYGGHSVGKATLGENLSPPFAFDDSRLVAGEVEEIGEGGAVRVWDLRNLAKPLLALREPANGGTAPAHSWPCGGVSHCSLAHTLAISQQRARATSTQSSSTTTSLCRLTRSAAFVSGTHQHQTKTHNTHVGSSLCARVRSMADGTLIGEDDSLPLISRIVVDRGTLQVTCLTRVEGLTPTPPLCPACRRGTMLCRRR